MTSTLLYGYLLFLLSVSVSSYIYIHNSSTYLSDFSLPPSAVMPHAFLFMSAAIIFIIFMHLHTSIHLCKNFVLPDSPSLFLHPLLHLFRHPIIVALSIRQRWKWQPPDFIFSSPQKRPASSQSSAHVQKFSKSFRFLIFARVFKIF